MPIPDKGADVDKFLDEVFQQVEIKLLYRAENSLIIILLLVQQWWTKRNACPNLITPFFLFNPYELLEED